MEFYIAIAVVVLLGAYFLFKRADKNHDGKVDAAEAKAAAEEIKTEVKAAAKKTKATVGQAKVALKKAATKKKAAPKK